MDVYFRKLRNTGQKFDDDIRKLTRTWESPHLLIGGYGKDPTEASEYVERFLCELREVQDQFTHDLQSRKDYIANTDKFIANLENFYGDLKQQCDDVESMLSNYGYKPLEDNPESAPADESEGESSILTASQMEHSASPF